MNKIHNPDLARWPRQPILESELRELCKINSVGDHRHQISDPGHNHGYHIGDQKPFNPEDFVVKDSQHPYSMMVIDPIRMAIATLVSTFKMDTAPHGEWLRLKGYVRLNKDGTVDMMQMALTAKPKE